LRFRTACRALSLIVVVSLQSPHAFGQIVDDGTRNAARSLAGQGKAAFDTADWDRARDLFHRAYTLVPAPTIALYEGRALAKLRRFVEAEEAYMRAARTELDAESPEPFRKAVHDAEDDLLALQLRMPKVTIVPSGPGAREAELSVTLDGHPLKSALLGVQMPIDPGEHSLRALVPGAAPVQVTFSVVEKQQQKVDLPVPRAGQVAKTPKVVEAGPAAPRVIEAVPSAPKAVAPPEQRPAPWQLPAALVAGGVGVAGLATGVMTGLMAGSRYSNAERECPEHACIEGSAGWETVQSFRTLRTVSTVGYIVGGLGLAGGATLFLLAPKKAPSSVGSVAVWLNVSSVNVAGAF
jgi:hypothetical protein